MTSLLGDSLLISPDPAVSSLDARLSAVEADVASLDGRLTTVEADLDQAELDILGLDTRLDQFEQVWQPFTPTLEASTTDPTLGTGSVQLGRFLEIPVLNLAIIRFYIQFGSSGANPGNGEYWVGSPVSISSEAANTRTALGSAVLFDWSVAGHKELAMIARDISSQVIMVVDNATVFHNAPFTWAVDDRFGGTYVVETS